MARRRQPKPQGPFCAVVEPPSRDVINTLQDACGGTPFFFVAEVSEVQKLLTENVKVVDPAADSSWQTIFDAADQNVLESKDVDE